MCSALGDTGVFKEEGLYFNATASEQLMKTVCFSLFLKSGPRRHFPSRGLVLNRILRTMSGLQVICKGEITAARPHTDQGGHHRLEALDTLTEVPQMIKSGSEVSARNITGRIQGWITTIHTLFRPRPLFLRLLQKSHLALKTPELFT